MAVETPEISKCKKGEAQQIINGISARPALLWSTPYAFIHTFIYSTPEMEAILAPLNVRI
jgi:hypothetical protein